MNAPTLPSYALGFTVLALFACGTLTASPEKSWKRGVSANVLSSAQIAELEPGVSWVYNWGPSPDLVDVNGEIEFIPFVWGQNQTQLDGVKAYLDGGATPSAVFFLNEPNFADAGNLGSGVAPLDAANWLGDVRTALADYSDIPLIGPHMALGGPEEDSITAFDPIQMTEVTYTTGELYLDAYDYYVGDNPTDALSLHSYGNGEMEFWVDTYYARTNTPVWVTEFAFIGTQDEDELFKYIVETLDFLEHSPKVARYAWFKADISSQNTALALLVPRSSALTRLGELYVNYPSYDPNYYYSIPTRIQAEAYIDQTGLLIDAADTDEGMGALFATARGSGSATYQVNVPSAGSYDITIHTTGASTSLPSIETNLTIGLMGGAQIAATSSTLTDQTRNVNFTLDLPAGDQTLELMTSGLGVKIDWLEISSASSGATWAGYPITDSIYVDTGDFMGWLSIAVAPWVYSFDLSTFIYLPEAAVKSNGAWIYLLK